MFRSARSSALRTVLPAAAFGVFAALLLIAGARWAMRDAVGGPAGEGGWTQRSRAAFTLSGFYGREFDPAGERHFAWTRDTATLSFSTISRTRAHRVTLDLRGGRPDTAPPARLRVRVEARLVADVEVPAGPSRVIFEIPRADRVGAEVTLETSPMFTPGTSDPRALGVIVDGVSIAPVSGVFAPSGVVILCAALAAFAAVLGIRLCGVRGALGAAASLALVLAFTWLLLKDAAFMGLFPERLLRIAAGAALAGGIVAIVRSRWPALAGAPEWSVAAGLVLAVSVVKLALFWHPLAIVGDGIFQVHRAQIVHSGQFFFTSVTPKPFFEFPYPVALYVFAQPFWNMFPTELDLLRLLRVVAIVADGLVALALYGAARRQWNDRATALFCALLWPCARAPFEALSNANLTNLFGQSVFGAALAGIAWMAAGSTVAGPGLLVISALLVIAFLSHFGTVTVGVSMLGAAGVVLLAVGRGHTRRMGAWVFALLLVAAAVSWVVYYSHFTEVYAKTFASVSAGESDDSSKLVASPAVKLQRWWSGNGDDYGRPGTAVLLIALAGAVVLLRRHRQDGATLVFLAWGCAWVALTALGILTPITLRANLAAAPVFILLSAVALGALASRSTVGTAAACILAVIVAWDGWRIGVACLRMATGQ